MKFLVERVNVFAQFLAQQWTMPRARAKKQQNITLSNDNNWILQIRGIPVTCPRIGFHFLYSIAIRWKEQEMCSCNTKKDAD